MSSIRPLATITVLAAVGVFLYLKINETEPPLPEGVEDWSASTELEFDMGGDDPMASPQFDAASVGNAAPAFSAAPAANESAPSFNANVASSTTANANATSANVGAAPTWPGSAAESAAPVAVAAAPSFNTSMSPPPSASLPSAESPSVDASSVNAASAEAMSSTSPELPDLPPMPPSPSTAPSVAAVAPMAERSASQSMNLAEPPSMSAPETTQQASTPPTTPTPSTNVATTTSTTPPVTPPADNTVQAQSSLFSATRLAVQAALDRGELSQALLLLSDWYDDPSLSASESAEVSSLLGQLAGSVIYSTEHRLEPPYMVQAGERLETIAMKYDVPWQLLAKINGITSADQLQPGQQLKVVRGPFSALIDIGQRKMTLMLDRRYAGRFALDIDSSVTVEEGHWEVNQKLLTPANASLPGVGPTPSSEERSLLLSNSSGGASQVAVLRGAIASNPLTEPAGRVLRLNPSDAADVFDILTLGSKVVIRR